MPTVNIPGVDLSGLEGKSVIGTHAELSRLSKDFVAKGGPFAAQLEPIMRILLSSPAFAAQLGQIGKATNVLQSGLAQRLGTTGGGTTGIGKTASAIGQSAGGFAAAQARGQVAGRAEDIALQLLLAKMQAKSAKETAEAGQGGGLAGFFGSLGSAFLGGLPSVLFPGK